MNGWFGFIGYIMIMTIMWRIAFGLVLDRDVAGDRVEAAVMSGLVAAFWPLTLIIAPILWFVMRPTPGERRQDREDELRRREREVERLARQYKLPLPKSAEQVWEREHMPWYRR